MLICHASSVSAVGAAAAARWPEAAAKGEIDLLNYGEARQQSGFPEGVRVLSSGASGSGMVARGWAALRLVAHIHRRRYTIVAVAQPALSRSRARGVLVSISHLIGAGAPVVMDPVTGRLGEPVPKAAAFIDLARWGVLHALSHAVASAAGHLLRRAGASNERSPSLVPSPPGSVVYLRTDINLALVPLTAGGSVAHTEGILRALLRRGYSPQLWSTLELAGMPVEVPYHQLPTFRRGNIPTEVLELVGGILQALASPPRPESLAFVYQRYSLNNLAGFLLARRWRVPLILEANSSEVEWRRGWSALHYSSLATACERFLLRRADMVVTVSENAAAELRGLGADPQRLKVIPNAVDTAPFLEAEPETLPFPEGSFVVCFVGLFYPWHGVHHLARAFVSLHRERPDARLVLVGDGTDTPVVRSILESAGVAAATHMPGLVARERVPSYLAGADVLASPHADVDGFVGSPIKIFEYMAAGRAIVASRVGQIGTILRDRETALLTPPGDEEALIDALALLHNDPDLRGRLGRAAQAEAHEWHSWDARLDALLDGRRE